MSQTEQSNKLSLPGLDGSNPLAFLAALGTLRVLGEAQRSTDARIGWQVTDGRWIPALVGRNLSEDAVSATLWDQLDAEPSSPWTLDKKLPFEGEKFRAAVQKAAASTSPDDRTEADFLAALGCDALRDKDGRFADTALRMVRAGDSAGQGMLDYAVKIKQYATAADIHETLFGDWNYDARGPSLRWDPLEAREYALLASDPSKGGVLSVIGANCLALQALPMFTTCPTGKTVTTVGFRKHERVTELTWPLWQEPLTLKVIGSLLTHEEIHKDSPSPLVLRELGVAVVFRSTQFKPNQYYLNFAPARSV